MFSQNVPVIETQQTNDLEFTAIVQARQQPTWKTALRNTFWNVGSGVERFHSDFAYTFFLEPRPTLGNSLPHGDFYLLKVMNMRKPRGVIKAIL